MKVKSKTHRKSRARDARATKERRARAQRKLKRQGGVETLL